MYVTHDNEMKKFEQNQHTDQSTLVTIHPVLYWGHVVQVYRTEKERVRWLGRPRDDHQAEPPGETILLESHACSNA